VISSSAISINNFTSQVEQARNQSQIFNRKSISRNTTHRQSYHLILSFYLRGRQPFWNCELLLVHRGLMRRATSLIHTSEIIILLNLPSIILVLIFVNVKTLIMLTLFLEQTRGRPIWSLRTTWCPRAPRWWPLFYLNKMIGLTMRSATWNRFPIKNLR